MRVKALALKRTVVYSVVTALLTGVVLSFLLISDLWLRSRTGHGSLRFGILAAFAVALVFQPLRDAVQQVIDRIFYKTNYDYQRILRRYSQLIAHPVPDLDRFARLAPYLLCKSMRLSGASVLVLDRYSSRYSVRAGIGSAARLVGLTLNEDSALIRELNAKFDDIGLTDLDRSLKGARRTNQERAGHLAQIRAEMEKLNTVLVIPAISKSGYFHQPTLLATINLGKKLSDESFSEADLSFLEMIATQAALSIEYVFILDELKKNQARVVDTEKLAALGTTVAGIAHELKNPLTYLEIVAQSLAESWDNPAFKESVIRILPSEVERMKLIIDGLSDYSKSHELRLEPVEVTKVLDRTLAILGYEIKRREITVVKHYAEPGAEPAFALADKDRLIQVFMNLIVNALQAMTAVRPPEGGPAGQLSLEVRRKEQRVEIAVTDTGPGIPQENLTRIFDPFFTTKASGAGLGLSITKKIVDEHNGSIQIDSRDGTGATFTVCLPAAA
ncbi:MAG: GHKL domain-containing protein [Candidatus Saganbacteria bacterium]|nr:GHKL domain-containing protein [Candidatus Saganbacteria bacterium]